MRQLLTAGLRLATITLVVVFVCGCLWAQAPDNPQPNVIEVYLYSTRTLAMAGAESATVLDPEIAQLEIAGETLRFSGLQRGETLAIIHVDGKPVSLIVRVILRPVIAAPPSLGTTQSQRGAGTFGSDVQLARANGQTTAMILDSLAWRQQFGGSQLSVALASEHSTAVGQYGFNLRTGNISYTSPRFEFNLLDFSVNLSGASGADRVPTVSLTDSIQLRGASASYKPGKNQFSIYAGVSVPYYFLSLANGRDVTGVAFRRQLSAKLVVFGATNILNIPHTAITGTTRGTSFMQQGGFSYVPSARWAFSGVGGVSNSGTLFRGNVNYTGSRFSAFASALRTSPQYPLNQLQSLFAGTASIRAGITSEWSRRIGGSFYFEHTANHSGLLSIRPATSDYYSPALTFVFNPRHSATFTYTHSRSEGGFQAIGQAGNRFDFSLRSVFGEHVMNSAQVLFGNVKDPLQVDSESRFSLNDSLSFRVRTASLQLTFSHIRTNPSLVQKLTQELSLLSPQLQQLFFQDPVAFVGSDLPPEIRSLLESSRPVSTAFGMNAQIPLTRKLTVTPNVSVDRDTSSAGRGSWGTFFGYGLNYQVAQSLLVRSSLNSVWATNTSQPSLQRTTVFSTGVVKSFSGSPAHLLARRSHRILQGHVFRDENIDGVLSKGERGLAGIQVQLDDGQTVATDALGVYRFAAVSGGTHHVSVNLAQFSDPVRMTTRGDFEIDMDANKTTSVDFGIIDFARVMGTVFNDLRFEGKPQPDSVGIGNLRLILSHRGDTVATIVVPPSGRFEQVNVPPGDYTLSIDPDTIPANYTADITSIPVNITPVTTFVVNIPLRANRSIAGHVFVKRVDQQTPLPGVKLAAGISQAITADDGSFVLRNLPAGDLTVGVVPLRPVPETLKVPAGNVHMPNEPVQIQNATIVLSNPDIVPYLTTRH